MGSLCADTVAEFNVLYISPLQTVLSLYFVTNKVLSEDQECYDVHNRQR